MTTITTQRDDEVAQSLGQLATAQHRSREEIVREVVTAYVKTARPRPKGIGKYHSGQTDGAEKAREILREAVREGRWP